MSMKREHRNFFIVLAAWVIGYFILKDQEPVMRAVIVVGFFVLCEAYQSEKRYRELTKEKVATTFVCIYEKDIIAFDSDEVLAHLTTQQKLPFVPYVGLVARGQKNLNTTHDYQKDDIHDYYTGVITSVLWNDVDRVFTCKVAPHKMVKNRNLGALIASQYSSLWRLHHWDEDGLRVLREYVASLENEVKEIEAKASGTETEPSKARREYDYLTEQCHIFPI